MASDQIHVLTDARRRSTIIFVNSNVDATGAVKTGTIVAMIRKTCVAMKMRRSCWTSLKDCEEMMMMMISPGPRLLPLRHSNYLCFSLSRLCKKKFVRIRLFMIDTPLCWTKRNL